MRLVIDHVICSPGIEVVGCSDQGARRVVVKNDDVQTLDGMIDDDYWPVTCS